MIRSPSKGTARLAVVGSLLFVGASILLGFAPHETSATGPGDTDEHGVYVRLLEGPTGSFASMVSGVRESLAGTGFEVLADYPAGVDGEACAYGAHVFVVHDEAYAAEILSHGVNAAFALPLRLAVFEDESGVHAALANPLSLNRTIVSEEAVSDLSAQIVTKVRETVASAGVGAAVAGEYGQMRDRGLIGKTMGIMAGGPFASQIEEVTSVPLDDFDGAAGVAEALAAGIEAGRGEWKWGIRSVYSVVFPEVEIAIVGLTGDRVEIDSFSIVGPGMEASREGYACPGIDHAAAYPLELVIARDGDDAKVLLVDEMFRMKMYFEDAGKMKFATNMRMPGSIESEIRDKVEEALY